MPPGRREVEVVVGEAPESTNRVPAQRPHLPLITELPDGSGVQESLDGEQVFVSFSP